MSIDDEKKGDLFGLAAYGEALNTLAKGTVDGAGAFLSRICLPAAEEFGLLLRDKVSAWRARNAIQIVLAADRILEDRVQNDELHAHPRLVMKIVSEGSWVEDGDVQRMWAGLLASSCTEEGRDETNLIFVNILSQLTGCEARIINYGCEASEKMITEAGWLSAEELQIELDPLVKLTGVLDFHRLDRELDHLRSLELIGGGLGGGGFHQRSRTADITPSSLALQMYARCCGHVGSPVEFYNLDESNEA